MVDSAQIVDATLGILLHKVSRPIPGRSITTRQLNKSLPRFVGIVPIAIRNLRACQTEFTALSGCDCSFFLINDPAHLSCEGPANRDDTAQMFFFVSTRVPVQVSDGHRRFCRSLRILHSYVY